MLRRSTTIGLVFLGWVLATCEGIRQDEFECEEALKHLATCCPGFEPATYQCYGPACFGGEHPSRPGDPYLATGPYASCYLAYSCEEIASGGKCEALVATSTQTRARTGDPLFAFAGTLPCLGPGGTRN